MINNNKYKNINDSLLEELETKRVRTEKKSSIFKTIALVFSLAVLFYSIYEASLTPLIILIIFGPVIYVITNANIEYDYVVTFKQEIIKPLIENINETFTYKQDRKVPRFIFKKSKLFSSFNKYDGDDFVSGEIDGVKFSLSELFVYDEVSSDSGKVSIKIFEGVFGEFDFNKKFSSTLLVYPKEAKKNLGKIGVNTTKDKLVKLDSPEFEKHFFVYGNDQVEARYLLTFTMMEYILKLKERLNAPIYLSFNESKLYIAVNYDGVEQFEPDITASLLNNSYVQKHLENINYYIEIIENFKLNEFLWSKLPKKESKAELKQEMQASIIENIESEKNINDYQDESKEISKKQVANKKEIYDEFYIQTSEIIKSLDEQRIRVSIYKTIFTILMILICIVLSIFVSDVSGKPLFQIATGGGFFTFLVILFGNITIESNYKDNYKTKLIDVLFKHINSTFVYTPNNSISQDEMYHALLFRDWSSFMGDDYIEGKISNINVVGSELDIEVDDRNMFKGYFFVFDLEKYDNLDLRVFPSNNTFDIEDTAKVTIYDEDYTKDGASFKTIFSAYGSDKDAKKILSKEFISKLLFFYEELRVDKIFISCKGSKLYIGFDFNGEEFFEAPTSTKVHDEDKILFYIAFFNGVEELADSIL